MDELISQHGKTRYCHYSLAYHIVWCPKYRRDFLADTKIDADFKHLVKECCIKHKFALLEMETDRDHAHIFISAPPRFSPAKIAGMIKGYTARFLREKHPKLKKICGADQLWTPSYYVGTAGEVSAVMIRRYIAECQGK